MYGPSSEEPPNVTNEKNRITRSKKLSPNDASRKKTSRPLPPPPCGGGGGGEYSRRRGAGWRAGRTKGGSSGGGGFGVSFMAGSWKRFKLARRASEGDL